MSLTNLVEILPSQAAFEVLSSGTYCSFCGKTKNSGVYEVNSVLNYYRYRSNLNSSSCFDISDKTHFSFPHFYIIYHGNYT